MKTYKVTASYVTRCTIEIEAEDEDQAYQLARDLDGGSFQTVMDDDWHIDHVMEVTRCTT